MNKYEIIGIVGEGAYGIVYKAKNKDTGAFGKYLFTFFILQDVNSHTLAEQLDADSYCDAFFAIFKFKFL